ncbi:acetyl-CoA carboxylase biotin carboxyl carrier protein subunit [Membranihabitans marinus]|uniref:acetyl-CoA carboxylase biotin carboxyl carrier protein subunit n=1 Tax=Membranihabitans marinus TaxID=1227546 RepID=UPI001F329E71|nr:acetyl-CoA carboxylase biotin carboxyl carrier protein subunit [Membranihabitans marinus]
MITAHVNHRFIYVLDKVEEIEYQEWAPNQFYLYHNHRKYHLTLLDFNPHQQSFSLMVDGYHFSIDLKDDLRMLIDSLTKDDDASSSGSVVLAPIPGVIKQVFVEVDATVDKDSSILVLEAMKMENIISAPASGTLVALPVVEGQNVSKGDLLFRILPSPNPQ